MKISLEIIEKIVSCSRLLFFSKWERERERERFFFFFGGGGGGVNEANSFI